MAQEKVTPSLRNLQVMAMNAKILTEALSACLDIPEAEDITPQLATLIYGLTLRLDDALDEAATVEQLAAMK